MDAGHCLPCRRRGAEPYEGDPAAHTAAAQEGALCDFAELRKSEPEKALIDVSRHVADVEFVTFETGWLFLRRDGNRQDRGARGRKLLAVAPLEPSLFT